MVYASGSALRSDVSGPGTWVFAPARLADGETVVVNRGFVPTRCRNGAADRAAAGSHGEPVELTGYIRFPESRAG